MFNKQKHGQQEESGSVPRLQNPISDAFVSDRLPPPHNSKTKKAYYRPSQSSTLASEEEEREVNIDFIKSKKNYVLKRLRKIVRRPSNSTSLNVGQFNSDQLVKKVTQNRQNTFSSFKYPSDDCQSTEIKGTLSKSHYLSTDSGRRKEEEIKVQNNPENNDIYENLGSSVFSKNTNAVKFMPGTSLPIEGKNSLKISSFIDPVTQSQSTEIECTPGNPHYPRCDDGRRVKKEVRVHSNDEKNDANGSLYGQDVDRNSASAVRNISDIGVSIEGKNLSEDSSYSDQSTDITFCTVFPESSNLQEGCSGCATASKNTYLHNVPAQSSKFQEGRPSSGLAADSINKKFQDTSLVLATSAFEQSGKPINASKKPSSNDKSGYIYQDSSKRIDLKAVLATSASEQSGKPINASKKPSSNDKSGYIYQDTSKRIDLKAVLATSASEQSGKPINASKKPSSNGKSGYIYQDTSKRIDLKAVLATSASEQSGKPINASKKPSSNGKSQNMKDAELEVATNVERVPQTSVGLPRDPSNLPNADLTDWIVLESVQHRRERNADFTTEPPFLDSSSCRESRNVELENVNLENFQNQFSVISREEQKNKQDIFDVKGNVISNWLRNAPKEQAIEAERQIAYIMYKSKVDAGQGKSQTENLSNNNQYTRRPVNEMCEGKSPPSRRSPSPRTEIESRDTARVISPYKRLYPQLSPEMENGDWEEEENTEMEGDGQNLSEYDSDSEFDEQESEEEVITANRFVSPPIEVRYIPESEKRPPSKKKPKQSKQNASPKPPASYSNMLCALVGILSAVAAIIFGTLYWPEMFDMFPKMNTPPSMDVATIIENLKGEFSEQPPMTFKIVSSAVRRVIEPDPKEPAIIVLFAEQGAEEIASHLARKIAESVTSPGDIVLISGHTYRDEDHDTAKKEIDNLISENLREDVLGAVLIERLDYIPAEAAIILHTYCDHENAPFRRAVYVMTIASKKTQLKLHQPKDWDLMVQEHLYEAWSTVGNDQVSSLLSRLTVSVAAIVSGG